MTTTIESEISFTLENGKELALMIAPGVFSPTQTTRLLIQAVQKVISTHMSLLDHGCGPGVVGLALHLQSLVKSPIYASDLSSAAVHCSRENFSVYQCSADVREGSLFEPWLGKKFDVIVDDISGIAQDIAVISPWFNGIPCETGSDGTALVINVLRQASTYLNDGGRLFFPVISLSNVSLILKEAEKNFDKIEMVARQEWPMPLELKEHMPLLKKLESEGHIKLKEQFGMVLCYTEIYCATHS